MEQECGIPKASKSQELSQELHALTKEQESAEQIPEVQPESLPTTAMNAVSTDSTTTAQLPNNVQESASHNAEQNPTTSTPELPTEPPILSQVIVFLYLSFLVSS